MPRDSACAFRDTLGRRVVDRLRKLDDLAVRKTLEDPLAEILVCDPDIAEIAAAMDEDRSTGHRLLQLFRRKIIDARDIGWPFAAEAILQIGHLTQPDRGIAAVADVRKIEDRHRLFDRQIVLEAVMNPVLQFLDQDQV